MDNKTKEFIKENAVSEGFLQDWYQNSVLETDTPVWTDEHSAEEVVNDLKGRLNERI